jgi:Fe-coproporphyrin III synthase
LLYANDIIVSLDGDEATHDRIRNIPGAFKKLREGVEHIKSIDPVFPITARTVIHRLNFRSWPAIIEAAKKMGLDQISFLPADVSSHAFNRETLWGEDRQHEIIPGEEDLKELKDILESVISNDTTGFIAESPDKLRKIYTYYAAFYGQNEFPYKKCNAPWVSTVVEADGTVRPCFFHPPIGNIRKESLEKILNSDEAIRFRKDLDMDSNNTCVKCVCYLHLSPRTKLN